MTRHNLAGHIAWLLSNEVTLPASVNATNCAAAFPFAQTDIEEGHIVSRGLQELSIQPDPRIAETVNVERGFSRPGLTSNPKQTSQVYSETFVQESMGKLASASRSKRPALASQQHQLATPASTTASSGLTQGYATFLRASNG